MTAARASLLTQKLRSQGFHAHAERPSSPDTEHFVYVHSRDGRGIEIHRPTKRHDWMCYQKDGADLDTQTFRGNPDTIDALLHILRTRIKA